MKIRITQDVPKYARLAVGVGFEVAGVAVEPGLGRLLAPERGVVALALGEGVRHLLPRSTYRHYGRDARDRDLGDGGRTRRIRRVGLKEGTMTSGAGALVASSQERLLPRICPGAPDESGPHGEYQGAGDRKGIRGS